MNKENPTTKRWLETAREQKATHIIDVCDTFNYDHYPVYVLEGESLDEKRAEYDGKEMQSVYGTLEVDYPKEEA